MGVWGGAQCAELGVQGASPHLVLLYRARGDLNLCTYAAMVCCLLCQDRIVLSHPVILL